jgi:hypothetical protein
VVTNGGAVPPFLIGGEEEMKRELIRDSIEDALVQMMALGEAASMSEWDLSFVVDAWTYDPAEEEGIWPEGVKPDGTMSPRKLAEYGIKGCSEALIRMRKTAVNLLVEDGIITERPPVGTPLPAIDVDFWLYRARAEGSPDPVAADPRTVPPPPAGAAPIRKRAKRQAKPAEPFSIRYQRHKALQEAVKRAGKSNESVLNVAAMERTEDPDDAGLITELCDLTGQAASTAVEYRDREPVRMEQAS